MPLPYSLPVLLLNTQWTMEERIAQPLGSRYRGRVALLPKGISGLVQRVSVAITECLSQPRKKKWRIT